VCSEAAYWAS